VLLLIRHALVDACGRFLAGRRPAVHLNRDGRLQAAQLGRCFGRVPIHAVYSSPLERAIETATAIAGGRATVAVMPDLTEIDFGEWTGLSFEELNTRPLWHAFNASRSSICIPGGERMTDVQTRACRCLQDIHAAHAGQTVVLVSHGDVLRSIVARVIGAPLDNIGSFEIDPASISVLVPKEDGFAVSLLNGAAQDFHLEPYGIASEAACAQR
jgi:broad specificity phosphatase PhoE